MKHAVSVLSILRETELETLAYLLTHDYDDNDDMIDVIDYMEKNGGVF
mgnify:CR=1 FL=1